MSSFKKLGAKKSTANPINYLIPAKLESMICVTWKNVFSKIIRSFIFCLPLILLSFCTPKKDHSTEFVFRVSLLMNEQHTWFKAFENFSDQVFQESNGRIKVEVYPSEQLAKEIEAVRMIQAEIIDMTTTGALLNNWMEIAAFCEMPFLLKDSIHKKALIEGEIGERIKQDMLNFTGLRPVAYFQAGPRMLTSNRPIKHPNDLKGLIVRVPNVPSFVIAWGALGAKPTPMAFSEVFTSLQQGTIEAQENPLALIHSAGFAEVQKYVNLTAHVNSWSYVVVGEKQFQKMPAELQAIFLSCAHDMQVFEHQLYLNDEARIKEELLKKGMEFIEVDNLAFSRMSEKAIINSLSPGMQKIYYQIQDLDQ